VHAGASGGCHVNHGAATPVALISTLNDDGTPNLAPMSSAAANKLAVAIPRRRVVRTDGALSGYAWGARKKELLEREAAKGGWEPNLV
jgi:AraC family transcriptional regulator, regulatory protein of adaptative response / methylated-DNA-[protein]-cysteine methyltransferase